MKLKAGDKVRIRTFVKRPRHWNFNGEMDHLMGQMVKIAYINGSTIIIKDWVWSFELSDFEEIASDEPYLNVIL